jgi:sec-independent protein translocase protein TatB
MLAKARAMANEFRSSFDEMARQSELDELRKEVEALRSGQGAMYPLGAEADAAFKEINAGLTTPPSVASLPTPAVDEWPDASPVSPLEPEPEAKSKPNPRPRSKRGSSTAETSATPAKTKKTARAGGAVAAKTRASAKGAAKTQISDAQAPAQSSAKTKTPRKKAVEL